MKEEIEKFKIEFNKIKKMGYVRAVNNNYSGIGLTLESLLGKKFDCFSMPDYNNIELKSKLYYSKRPINLFKMTPEGKDFFETKRLWNEYGFFRQNNKNYKVLYCTTCVGKISKIGFSYYFSLNVNFVEKKLELLVYDTNKTLIEKYAYWSFYELENTLLRKLKYLAVIKVLSTTKNKYKYYKYFRLSIYKLINFDSFLNLLKNGKIYVIFSIDVFNNGKRKNQIHDHGTNFSIYEKDLTKLFHKLQ